MSRRLLFACACLVATAFAPDGHAQGTSSSSGGGTSGESVSSPILNPYRFLVQNGQYVDVTNNPRPQNLNPTGCNFADCEQDLELQFPITYSGFAQGDAAHIEVWAGTVDCTQDANRNQISTSTAHPCWEVAPRTGPIYATVAATKTFTVFARDVLRFEAPPVAGIAQSYDPSFHSSAQGESACHVQTSDAAVPISIYFIPVSSSEGIIGTAAYKFPFNTDLVAPPAPTNVSLNPGDTLLQVTWTSPGNDPDLVGYAVYSDPPAGGSTTGGCSCGNAPGSGANSYVGGDGASSLADATTSRCVDAASEAASATDAFVADEAEAAAASDADLEAALPEGSLPEASTDAASDAGVTADGGKGSGVDSGIDSGGPGTGDAGMMSCTNLNVGGGGLCVSTNLTGHIFTIGSSTTTTTTDASTDVIVPVTGDDSSTSSTGAEGGVTLAGGGIAEIDPKYKAGEIDDITGTQLTLTGLTNGLNYVVVVTSIDGSGNVGPISEPPSCKQPEPTGDYWKTYKKDGGNATGCALGGGAGAQVFGVGIALAAAALARRRRR